MRLKNFTMDESETVGEIQGCAEKEDNSIDMKESMILNDIIDFF